MIYPLITCEAVTPLGLPRTLRRSVPGEPAVGANGDLSPDLKIPEEVQAPSKQNEHVETVCKYSNMETYSKHSKHNI